MPFAFAALFLVDVDVGEAAENAKHAEVGFFVVERFEWSFPFEMGGWCGVGDSDSELECVPPERVREFRFSKHGGDGFFEGSVFPLGDAVLLRRGDDGAFVDDTFFLEEVVPFVADEFTAFVVT